MHPHSINFGPGLEFRVEGLGLLAGAHVPK